MSDQELKYKITTEANTAGAQQAAAAIEKIDKSAKAAAPAMAKAGKGSKEMADGLGKSVAVGTATTQLLQNLGQVGQGGAAGMLAFGRSILALGQVIKAVLVGTGPIGIAIAALGLLAGAVFALKDAFKPAGESLGEFKSRLESLDKANLNQLASTVTALTDRLKTAKDEADGLRAAMDKVDDAEMGAKLAANKASGLKPAEKEKQDFLIRDEFKKRREGRELQAAELERDQAKEKKDALAPEFEDKRNAYAEKLVEMDKNRALAEEAKAAFVEAMKLRDSITGSGDRQGWAAYKQQLEKARGLNAQLPSIEQAQKMDVELAQAKKNFQGEDGGGGIAKDYQAAAAEATKAEKALQLLLKTRKDVAEWEKAQVKIENGGVDPRDAEIAARKSPGKARMVGPDGKVKEYDVRADPTANQQISAAAEAAKSGQTQPALANQITSGPLKPGSDNTLAGAAGKVADAAGKSDSAGAATQDQLAKIGEGSAKIAENTSNLSTQISTAATELSTANDGLARAIAAATGELSTTIGQAIALGAQNVTAYTELSSQVRDLAQQVRTAMSQLAAARSRK